MADTQQRTQPSAYTADGEPIAPEDTAAAVREGRGFFQKGERVYAKTTGGEFVSVPAKDAALPKYTVLTPEEVTEARRKKDATSASGMVKTVAEGAARTIIEPSLFYDEEGRKAAQARKRYNPKLELTGQVGGNVAAIAATAGGGLARLLGKAALPAVTGAEALGGAAARGAGAIAGEGVLGKAAQLGARGLAEGAVYGAKDTINNAILDDVPLTAEQLLAGAFEGGAAGGLLGGGLGFAGGVLGKGARALGKGVHALGGADALKSAARSYADEAAAAALGGKGSSKVLGRELLDRGLIQAGDRAEDIAARVAAASEQNTANLGALRAHVDDVLSQRPDLHPTEALRTAVGKADDLLQPLRESSAPAVRLQVKQADEALAGLREVAEGAPVQVTLPDGTTTTAPRQPLTFTQLEELRAGVQLPKGASPEVAKAFEQVHRTVTEPLDGAITQALGPQAKAYRDLVAGEARLSALSKLAQQDAASGGGGLSGLGMGSIMSVLTGNVGGVAVGAASDLAKHMVEKRGRSVLALVAERAAQSSARIDVAAQVAAMAAPAKRLVAPVAISVSKLFDQYTKDLERPDEEVAQHVGALAGDLNQYAPEVGAAVTERALADREYLRSVAPTPTTNANATLTPKATKHAYSFDQKQQFVDAATALERPLSVFEDIARGELPLAKIEALKERRPKLWSEMRVSVVRHTADRSEVLPYSRRVLLGLAFDFPADWSMVNVGSIQQTVATPPEKAPTDPRAAPSKVTDDPGANVEPGVF